MTADEFLQLIAEGYFYSAEHDRYILVENPHWKEPSDDLYLIWDSEKKGLYKSG